MKSHSVLREVTNWKMRHPASQTGPSSVRHENTPASGWNIHTDKDGVDSTENGNVREQINNMGTFFACLLTAPLLAWRLC